MNKKVEQRLLQKVVSDYDKIAKDFDSTRHCHWKEFQMIKPYLKAGQQITDIGCGNGRLYKFLTEVQPNISYIGLDNSKKLLEQAKKNFPNATFQEATLTKTNVPDQSQDIVATIAAFHHLPSVTLRKESLQEISRILKKDGLLILTAWNLFQPKYEKYLKKAKIKSMLTFGRYKSQDTFIPWAKTDVKRYYYAFRENELKSLVEEGGFKIVQSETGNNFTLICKKTQ